MRKYWLMKNEISDYSIAGIEKDRTTLWTGVRNYQARNFMTQGMNPGDWAIFYHSNAKPSGCAGLIEISKKAVPDPTALDQKSKYYDPKATPSNPIWFCVEVAFKETFKNLVSIQDMKANPKLAKLKALEKGSRLSVTPVTEAEFSEILLMGNSGFKI